MATNATNVYLAPQLQLIAQPINHLLEPSNIPWCLHVLDGVYDLLHARLFIPRVRHEAGFTASLEHYVDVCVLHHGELAVAAPQFPTVAQGKYRMALIARNNRV
jgi:hypothetical protein